MGELYEFVENPEPSLVTCISILFTGDKFGGNIYLKMEGIRFYHNDHLGTPQVLTDENGQIAWYGDYEPFGKVNILVERTTNNFRFPGQYFIEETGLYYNWNRWYHSYIGRYIEKEPIDEAIFRYIYASNNTIKKLDFMGLYESVYECYSIRCNRYNRCKGSGMIGEWICKKMIDASCNRPGYPCCLFEYMCCLHHCAVCGETGEYDRGKMNACNILKILGCEMDYL